jgi:RNase H-fold protein (predicted Holliday junction resolvase)
MNNETLTLGQFMTESTNFQYSNSFYEMIKESSELALMEMYADTSAYLVENAEEVAQLNGVAFMTEAADATKSEDLTKKINAKKSGLMGKIGSAFKHAWKAIVAFFGRIKNVFTNTQGKQIADLNNKITQVLKEKKFTEEMMQKKWKSAQGRIRELVEQMHSDEKTIMVLKADKASAESQVAALNKQFKGIDPGLYRELKKVEVFLSESYTIRAPKIVSSIDSMSERISKVVSTYKASKSGNSSLSPLKAAREVASLLHDIKESRVQYEDIRVSTVWINEVYESVKKSYEESSAEFDAMLATIGDASDTPTAASDSTVTTKIRQSTNKNFGEFSRNLTYLLAEYKGASAEVIRLLGTHIEKRSAAIRLEAELLHTLTV